MLSRSPHLIVCLCLALEPLQLSDDLASLLQGVLEVLLALRKEQVSRNVWQQFHDERIIYEV